VTAKTYTNSNQLAHSRTNEPDLSADPIRDDDPLPHGRVYDIDNPGITTVFVPPPLNDISRNRGNFKAYAVFPPNSAHRCSELYERYNRISYQRTGPMLLSQPTSAGSNTLTDTTQNWASDQWKGGSVHVILPTGERPAYEVTGNTATTITIPRNWFITPTTNSLYILNATNTWTQVNDVLDDNDTGDGGPIPLTWDLQ
jgi:hypothetical protein